MLKKEERQILDALRASFQKVQVRPSEGIPEDEFLGIMLVASTLLSRPQGLIQANHEYAIKALSGKSKEALSHGERSEMYRQSVLATEKWISLGLIHAELENNI